MKKYILGTGISLCLLMSSCLNDSFLEVYPKDNRRKRQSLLPMITSKRMHGDYIMYSSDIRMIRGRRTKYSAEILSRTI